MAEHLSRQALLRQRDHIGWRAFGVTRHEVFGRLFSLNPGVDLPSIKPPELLHPGDALRVTRIDRLARSIGDLQDIVQTVKARGASLKATEQPIDTGTAVGKCFLDMLGVFAEFETNLHKERQLEGIAKAKAAGVYKGRPASIDATQAREMKARGMRPTDIAKALGIGRASVYRVLEAGQ
jgi:DNA invertase Pin-like site-specific DNA recombinase